MFCKINNKHGFTLVEIIIVIAILICFLSISIVGIAYYAKRLKITELDNTAKEIYMAAQNRAILLATNNRLNNYIVKGDNKLEGIEIDVGSSEIYTIDTYYTSSTDENIYKLLPKDSIEPSIWEGNFYIVYEPESESVTDVFYFEDEIPEEANSNFKAFYEKWRKADKSERIKNKPMIGYYGGIFAESGDTIALRTPVINIINGDDLNVEITYWIPRTLEAIGVSDDIKLTTNVLYSDKLPVTLDDNKALIQKNPEISYISYKYTWTLDSLNGVHFYDLFEIPSISKSYIYGQNFTVKVEVAYEGDETIKINGASKQATDNSLFAKDTTNEVAKISCTRHLQNLDKNYSYVMDSITSAEQIADIQSPEYNFKPIYNTNLILYDGQNKYIKGLNIAPSEDNMNFTKNIGLFDGLTGTDAHKKNLNNISLINASMVSGSKNYVGSLVGTAENVIIDNCQVYWESQDESSTNLRALLGDSENGIQYKITSGMISGGLVGFAYNCEITNSSASTLVKGVTVGGLVGHADSTTISGCYSASYLAGDKVGGLLGNAEFNVTVSKSYATGFINSTDNGDAAGLSLGVRAVNIDNSYSSMLFTVPENRNITNYPLCETTGNYKNVYYLDSDLFQFTNADKTYAKSYSQLTDSKNWSNLFGDTFVKKSTNDSHPYNLQTTLLLTDYIYPALPDMPHYGDWGAQFQNGSLVYYEEYQNSIYGFSGGGLEVLKNDQIVLKDGYAVAYKGTEETSSLDITLTYNNTYEVNYKADTSQDKDAYPMYKVDYQNPLTGAYEEYYLLALPDDMVNTEDTSADFYQKITISKAGESDKVYYYNPHFANTIVDAESDITALAKNLIVQIRTARHFSMLGKYPTYYSSNNRYNFAQQLNINAGTYTGYNLFENGVCLQNPIGIDANTPFRCNYYGDCHTIENFKFNVKSDKVYKYIGLFGYSTGILKDIVYLLDGKIDSFTQSGSSSDVIYAGSLVGQNDGSIYNCAVSGFEISASGFNYSNIYVGGFVGFNRGTINTSSADVKNINLSATLSNAYTGGFAGVNDSGGSISKCYTVGKLFASQSRYGEVIVSGFSAKNNGTIEKSYSANNLNSNGSVVTYGFSNDAGFTSNCVYLNSGNFSYDGENYTAQYTSDDATPVTWEQLKNNTDAVVSNLNMNTGAIVYPTYEVYPYPNSVVNMENMPVHYGLYPDIMDLGTMGVYYWEKLQIGNNDPSYHFSVISVDKNQNITKSSTLSTAHDDGGVITDYGYGYFYSGNQPTVTSQNLGFTVDRDFNPSTAEQNTATNEGLSALMSNRYTFCSFDTWNTNKGLYVKNSTTDGTPPVGTLTLDNISFYINPFFADALSYVGNTQGKPELTSIAGTENNPYEIRSIRQLQFINWNINAKNNVRPVDTYNYVNFMFLNTVQNSKNYYWEQTHDIDGSSVKNYVPIAAIQDIYDDTEKQTGEAYAWFGGTYDGQDYTIKELSITNTGEYGVYNTTGLFGFTLNATLKNIVMYSPTGTAVIEAQNNSNNWYAIGGLVGLAANKTGTSGVIENCSVSGYIIKDSNKGCAFGGGGVGGLVGICNMALKKCTSETDIVLNYTHSVSNRNIRVGGLAGSCQQSITQCYAGGSITLGDNFKHDTVSRLHVGGLTGGYFMKVLYLDSDHRTSIESGVVNEKVPEDKVTKFSQCYTYVSINDDVIKKSISFYAIGGLSETPRATDGNNYLANYNNCYYLNSNFSDNVKKPSDINTNSVKFCSYNELAVGGKVFKEFQNYGFGEVTKIAVTGENIDGRFSFGISQKLLGTNYPFPTILTQSSNLAENNVANVHYGDWPVQGIERQQGTLPVNIDLFAKYDENLKETIHTETLSISNLPENGNWSVSGYDETIITAEVIPTNDNKTQTLKVTAKKQGSTVITVNYTVDSQTYSLNIEVNVTAKLNVASDNIITVFTDETATAPLILKNMNNEAISDTLKQEIKITNFNVEYDPLFFSSAKVEDMNLEVNSLQKIGSTRMAIQYTYEYLNNSYTATSVIALNVEQIGDIVITPIEFKFDDNSLDTQKIDFNGDNIQLSVNNTEIKDINIVDFSNIVAYKDIVFASWKTEGKPEDGLVIEAYKQSQTIENVIIQIKIQFNYGGSTHNMWQNLPINVIIEPIDSEQN